MKFQMTNNKRDYKLIKCTDHTAIYQQINCVIPSYKVYDLIEDEENKGIFEIYGWIFDTYSYEEAISW